jgi:hypothetical protein
MKPFLSKVFEIIRRFLQALGSLAGWVAVRLRAVNIDLARAVLLCLGLQLIVILIALVAFRPRIVQQSEGPVAGELQSPAPESDGGSAR